MADHVKLSLGTIASSTCGAFGIAADRLRGPLRLQPLVRARQAFMLLARREGYSFSRIARYLNGRDHTTVIHGCTRAEKNASEDVTYRERLQLAERKLERFRRARRGED